MKIWRRKRFSLAAVARCGESQNSWSEGLDTDSGYQASGINTEGSFQEQEWSLTWTVNTQCRRNSNYSYRKFEQENRTQLLQRNIVIIFHRKHRFKREAYPEYDRRVKMETLVWKSSTRMFPHLVGEFQSSKFQSINWGDDSNWYCPGHPPHWVSGRRRTFFYLEKRDWGSGLW